MEWIKTDLNKNDISFQEWQAYLTKIVCSVYKIPIGYFVGQPTGQYQPSWLFKKLQSLFN